MRSKSIVETSTGDLEEKPSKRENLKRLITRQVREWSLQSTSHGLPRLASSANIFTKIMWAIFLLVSIGICAFMVAKSVSSYLEYDVTTKIRQIPLDEIEFPAVSICNLNPYVTNEANEFWNEFFKSPLNFNLSKYFLNATDEEINSLRPKNETQINDVWLNYIIAHPKFNSTLRQLFSYWPSYFNDCHFRFISCNPYQVLEHFYHFMYGNCFRFNGRNSKDPSSLTSRTVGREGDGLGLTMFIGPPDLLFSYSYESYDLGVKIFITDRDIIPITQPGVLIKPGTTAFIQVSRVDTTTLSAPFSNCIDADLVDTELATEMRRIGMQYRRRDCVLLCEQHITVERFNCYLIHLPKIYNVPPCPYPYEIVFDMADCVKQCPHECSFTRYDLSISYGDYPSQLSLQSLMDRKRGSYGWVFNPELAGGDDNSSHPSFTSLELARASMIKLFVYFDEIKFTKMSEAPVITFAELVANIGGTLGLFIGISLLSLVELIELFFNMLTIIWFYFKTNQTPI